MKVKNINAVYLGSAQLDKKVESDAFLPHSEYSVIFVTTEWIAKEENCAKIQKLVQAENLSLIAIDEAHLFHLWQEFRLSYKKLEKLKAEFPNTPLMILTATNGIDSLPYYGEMDAKSRYSNYMKWKNDEVKVIVATAAFGMGIDKEDIRHVRYGVPESLTSWAQELGRAGRDGHPATATIYYSMSNTNHAMAWIIDHHQQLMLWSA